MHLFNIGLWLLTMQGIFMANNCQDKEVFRLEDLRWKKRVVVFYAESPTDMGYAKQVEAFQDREAVVDRDLVFVHLFKNSTSLFERQSVRQEDATRILKQLNPRNLENQVWLIGKDGGVKYQSDMPVKVECIYGLIDSMPMRREEMRQKKGGNEDKL